MYAIVIDYLVPLADIDRVLPEHSEWLDAHYRAGDLVASSARTPRDGGVVLAIDMPRDRIDAIVADDPFAIEGVAEHTVYEFHPTRLHADIATEPASILFR